MSVERIYAVNGRRVTVDVFAEQMARTWPAMQARAEAAEAKVARVEALLADWDDDSQGRHVHWSAVPRIRAALDGEA